MNQKGFSALIILIIVFAVFSIGVFLFNLKYPIIGEKCPQIDNTVPIYGDVKKCASQKLTDDLFIFNATNGKPQLESSRKRVSDAAIQRSYEYSSKGDYDTAMRRLNQAWLVEPTDYRIFWGFGNVLAQKKNFDEAFKMYDRALSMNPSVKEDNAQILCDYGLSHLQSASILDKNADNSLKEKEIMTKAADFIQRGLEVNPDNGQCHSLSALILFEKEKYPESWQEVKKAQQVGFKGTPQKFIDQLSSKMPDPGN